VFTVDSGSLNRSASNPSGRVRALLSPRNRTTAPASPPAAAAASTPTLKPSRALGDEKK